MEHGSQGQALGHADQWESDRKGRGKQDLTRLGSEEGDGSWRSREKRDLINILTFALDTGSLPLFIPSTRRPFPSTGIHPATFPLPWAYRLARSQADPARLVPLRSGSLLHQVMRKSFLPNLVCIIPSTSPTRQHTLVNLIPPLPFPSPSETLHMLGNKWSKQTPTHRTQVVHVVVLVLGQLNLSKAHPSQHPTRMPVAVCGSVCATPSFPSNQFHTNATRGGASWRGRSGQSCLSPKQTGRIHSRFRSSPSVLSPPKTRPQTHLNHFTTSPLHHFTTSTSTSTSRFHSDTIFPLGCLILHR